MRSSKSGISLIILVAIICCNRTPSLLCRSLGSNLKH